MRSTVTANAAAVVETDQCPAFSNARPYQASYGDRELDHINAWLQAGDFDGQDIPPDGIEPNIPSVTHTTVLATDLNGLLSELFSSAGHH